MTLSSNAGNRELLGNQQKQKEESTNPEIESLYQQLTAEQKVDLLLNQGISIDKKPFLAETFSFNHYQADLTNLLPFLSNPKAEELWAKEYAQEKGNLVRFGGLYATCILDKDFVSENPINRAKKLEEFQQTFLENGLSLCLDQFWLPISKEKDQSEMQTKWLSALRQFSSPLNVLSYDTLFEENGLLYKGSLQSSLELFRKEYGYKGLLIYTENQGDINKKMTALLSGVDMLFVYNEKELEALRTKLIERIYKKPELLESQVKRVLHFRHSAFQKRKEKNVLKVDKAQLEMQVKANSLVCIRNERNYLPIQNLNERFEVEGFNTKELELIQNFVLPVQQKATTKIYRAVKDNFPEILQSALEDSVKNSILIIDAKSIYQYRTRNLHLFSQIVVLPENDEFSSLLAIQAIFGSFDLKGKLPFFLTPEFKTETSIVTKNINRLRYLEPKHVGLSDSILLAADSVVQEALENETFPGCQVLFAWKNTVVYQKSFGFVSSKKKVKTNNSILYDIASVSKIAGSTCALMYLDDKGKVSLSKQLDDYLPELMAGSALQNIQLKDMMAHQAGLPAWIPFYSKTLTNNKLNPSFYSKDSSNSKNIHVAKDLYLMSSYPDSIYKRILAQKLGPKKYLYSDLGYYFVKKIVEKQGEMAFDAFLSQYIYRPLGLQNMQFNPYMRVELDKIAPTEDDKVFRNQLIQGYVHDPGAAMLGGVGGHAGLFCNSNDLAILMQMLLNGGNYGGKQILSAEKINAYTSVQFPESNRRGAGFDKPTLSGKGGTACDEASPESYGHSGFTGTLTWADPKYDINYVFLSNRVNPDAENWKIVKTNVRTRIQSVWYKAVKRAQLIDYTAYL